MAGRDEQFQHDLKAREAEARGGAAKIEAQRQALAIQMANRTKTTIELKGCKVGILRLVGPETEELAGVTLVFIDPHFNKHYTFEMGAENARQFLLDFGDVVAGNIKEGDEVPESQQLHMELEI